MLGEETDTPMGTKSLLPVRSARTGSVGSRRPLRWPETAGKDEEEGSCLRCVAVMEVVT